MVDAAIIEARLIELSKRVARARKHCPPSAEELTTNHDALELVAFNLMLAVQTCADIASHLIADEGWAPPQTIAGSFVVLRDQGVLSDVTAAALGRAVGLRNVVAHGYAGIDPARVHAAATTGLGDLDAFAREIAGWLTARPSSL